MSNQFHDPELDERLRIAACADHAYTPSCGYCVHRYFEGLLSSDSAEYVSKWAYMDAKSHQIAAEAEVKSLRERLRHQIEQTEFWKRSKVFQGTYPAKGDER